MDCNIVDRRISVTPPTSPTAEEHLSTQCRYVVCQVQHPDGYICYVWLRKCVCGQKVDMSYLTLTGKIPLSRQDGVDIHLSEACDWEERSFNGRNILKRNCFEETHIHSRGLQDVNREYYKFVDLCFVFEHFCLCQYKTIC